MLTIAFLAFVALSATVALVDWRRGWLLAVLVGVLQDPIRKLSPGTPVYLTFSIVGVYIAILFAVQQRLQIFGRDFARRFQSIWSAFGLVVLFLLLAAVNGIMTFGLQYWKAPLLSLFTYVAPLPAILLGYMYLDNEDRLYRFFTFYAVITSIALIGTPFEYYGFQWRSLGMVQQVGDYIRYLPGIELRMISGFYRAPDIMGWHAATLTAIAIGMIVRSEMNRRAWLWMGAACWGFYNCLISGRRKAIYYVAVFVAMFLWRYVRKLKPAHVGGFVMAAFAIGLALHHIASDQETHVYAAAAAASSEELTGRIEGGLMETIRQFGILGAGLGVATQGVQHVLSSDQSLSWQEGGLGKLAVELGLPGLFAAALLAFVALATAIKISGLSDHPSSSQLGRVTLFGLIMANIANFLASAQAYSDPVLTIVTCFFVGCLYATVALDERTAQPAAESSQQLVPATA